VEPRRLASLSVLVLATVVLAGCGGTLTASEVASMQHKLSPTSFADIRCAADRSSGWDYVCTYRETDGPRKFGVLVRGRRLAGGSGTVPLGDDLPDGPHLKAPTPEAYARRANRVCAERATSVRALPDPKNRYDLLDIGERVISLEELEKSRLAGIKPPDGERDQVGAFERSIDDVQRAIESWRDAFSRRDASDLVRAQAQLAAARRASNAAARRLGLSCRH
jgi:hypothetical protein